MRILGSLLLIIVLLAPSTGAQGAPAPDAAPSTSPASTGELPPLDDPAVVQKILDATLPLLDRGRLTPASSVRFLGEMASINTYLDVASLTAAGYAMDQPVFVTAKNIDLKTALDRLAKSIEKPGKPLKWAVENGVIVLSTEEDQNWKWLRLAANRSDKDPAFNDERVIEELPFDDMALGNALKLLRDQNINIYVHWSGLSAVNVDIHNRITAPLKRVRPRTAMQLLVRGMAGPKANVSYYLHDGVWVISTREQLDDLKKLWDWRAYGVKDQPTANKLTQLVEEAGFSGREFSDALEDLARMSELTIDVDWPSLAPAGIDRKTPIQMVASNIRLSTALDLVLAEAAGAKHQLEYTAKDSTIHITLKKPPAPTTKPARKPAAAPGPSK